MGQKADGARKGWLTTFCVGNVGYELMYEFYKNFENFFLTEICAFSTGVTTGITTVINAIKVFLTPAVGVAIDKDPFKARDKHTPWIVGMPVFLGLAFILMAWGAWRAAEVRSSCCPCTSYSSCLRHSSPMVIAVPYRQWRGIQTRQASWPLASTPDRILDVFWPVSLRR